MQRKWIIAIFSVLVLFGLAACEEEGPIEKAGEQMEEAGDEAEDAMENASEKLQE